MAIGTRPTKQMQRKRRRVFQGVSRTVLIAIEVAVPSVLLLGWWIVSASSTNAFYPPLSEILKHFQQLWLFAHFTTDILPSIGNLAAGFLLGGGAGILIGVTLGSVRSLSWLFAPVIDFWRAIPPVALVPIIVSLMGFGNETRIFTIALAALFPTLISTLDGVRAIDPQLREVARVYGLSRSERLFSVSLPAAGPRIASGLQVSLQVAFVVMIASEMLGSSYGIGAMTLMAQQSFAIADMWAGIVLLGVIGYLANLLFNFVRDRAMRWYVRSQQVGKEM